MEGIKRRRRLGESVWRDMLRRFDTAELSVVEFCKSEGVAESSFHRWRSRLTAAPSNAALVQREVAHESTPATFVDLGSLGATRPTVAPRLDLKLDLGGGLTLHLVRS